MPKMKTHKGVKARFKVTGTGKVTVNRSGRRHLLSGKRAKQKRNLRNPIVLAERDAWKVRTALPYA